MSNPRYDWYSNVVRTVRYYPHLREIKADAQAESVIANYTGMPGGGSASRTTEIAAMRTMSRREEEELEAIELTVAQIRRRSDGGRIIQIVDLVDWKRTHTIEGAAQRVHVSERMASSLRAQFIFATAKNLGYL
jgi:hypothetical protein